MKIIIKLFFFLQLIGLCSCQAKKVINYTKFENSSIQKGSDEERLIKEARDAIKKKNNEILLMFQYSCFFDRKVSVNNVHEVSFPRTGEIHYGQRYVFFDKNLGKIKIKLSDGRSFLINQKNEYDYITICDNIDNGELYIHYYNFPKLIMEE